VSRSRL